VGDLGKYRIFMMDFYRLDLEVMPYFLAYGVKFMDLTDYLDGLYLIMLDREGCGGES